MKISNNRLALIVLSVSCVGMIGLTTIKNEQLRPIRTAVGYFLLPVQTGVNRVGSAVYSNFKNQEKMRTALSDNESLREQVATLTMENTRLQSDSYELGRLRKLYELNQTYGQYRMTGARVIAKDTGNWFHVFRIDKGARDGIKPDMNVVGDGGLIGIVTDVGDNYATVRSIIDDVSRVSAMAIQSNDTCIVSGNLQLYANGKLKISDITDTADIKDGDAIVTSTVSSKFLPGILIGYAGDLKTDPDRLTRSGTLVPVADFETIQEVLVILDLKSEMREDGSFETPRTSLPDPESLIAAETSAAEESSAASETPSGEESGAAAETTVAAETSESRTTAETTTAATTTAASTTAARSTTAASTTRAAETRRETTAARRETRQRETTASAERRQQETERTRPETTAAQPQESAAATEPVQTVESLPSNP